MAISVAIWTFIGVALLPLGLVAGDDSWRCGIFFAGNPGSSPRAKVFILPRKFPANCENPRPDIYTRTCYEIMERGLHEWNFTSPSRIKPDSGKTIGDDLCGPIRKDIRAPGLQLGFYASYCSSSWIDTGLRTLDTLCCYQGKYVPC